MVNNSETDRSRYDQKLEFILRTAARIFAEKGYHPTSMRAISRTTEVSLAGLYYYCRSKEELLFLIQDNCFGRVLERIEERLRESDDPVERVRLLIENHLSFFAANMAEMKVLSHEAETLSGEMRAAVFDKKQQYTQLARKLLGEAAEKSGHGRSQDDLTVATFALFGMMNWIYNWYDPRGKMTVEQLIENIANLFLSGFLAASTDAHLTTFTVAAGVRQNPEAPSVWRAT